MRDLSVKVLEEGVLEGRVGVKVQCAIYHDEEHESYVAHFVGMGLLARAATEEEAVRRCKQLFNKFVHCYRSVGQLAQRLTEAGVEWWWEEDYPLSQPALEDTDSLMDRRPTLSAVEVRSLYERTYGGMLESRQRNEQRDLAIAA